MLDYWNRSKFILNNSTGPGAGAVRDDELARMREGSSLQMVMACGR